MGLSCGNPTALASLREGEVVLDLGAGAGLDVFVAAKKVGPKGRAIGVDIRLKRAPCRPCGNLPRACSTRRAKMHRLAVTEENRIANKAEISRQLSFLVQYQT